MGRLNENAENVFVVEKILDKRHNGGIWEYKIKWKGYDAEDENTWEPVKNCDCPDLKTAFEAEWKKKQAEARASRSPSVAKKRPSSMTEGRSPSAASGSYKQQKMESEDSDAQDGSSWLQFKKAKKAQNESIKEQQNENTEEVAVLVDSGSADKGLPENMQEKGADEDKKHEGGKAHAEDTGAHEQATGQTPSDGTRKANNALKKPANKVAPSTGGGKAQAAGDSHQPQPAFHYQEMATKLDRIEDVIRASNGALAAHVLYNDGTDEFVPTSALALLEPLTLIKFYESKIDLGQLFTLGATRN